eukprot:Sspe_Gene.37280::Locus_17992_Transcript_3_3_Confidence_0.667_Length_727::g.37280::m.37280
MTAGAKGPVTFQDVTKDLKEATPKDLVLWKKPIASGIVCASGSLLFLMILFMEFTLFSLACFLFQVAMVIFFIAKMVKRPLVPVMDTDYYKDIMRQKADQLSPLLADLAFQFNLVLMGEHGYFRQGPPAVLRGVQGPGVLRPLHLPLPGLGCWCGPSPSPT